jgi:hypothetical protein
MPKERRMTKTASPTKRSMNRPMSTLLLLAVVGLGGTGCAYAGMATTPDGTILIARNQLFGGLRKIYVCKLVGAGFNCIEGTNAP